MPEISIIIPAFNAEKFLNISLDSALNSDFRDFEIILVDDNSADKTYSMCLEYAKKDSRIKAFTHKGGSAAATRNFALGKARGNYIAFLDCDDFVEKNMYSEMCKTARDSGADLVICDNYKVSADSHKKKVTYNLDGGFYDKQRMIADYYKELIIVYDEFELPITISNWKMLIKRQVIEDNNIRYDERSRYCEDELFGCLCAYYANSMYYLKDKYFYNYNYTESSVTNRTYTDEWHEFKGLLDSVKASFLSVDDYDFTPQIKLLTLYFAMRSISSSKNNNFSLAYRQLKKIIKSDELKWAFEDLKIPKKISENQKLYFKLVKSGMVLPLLMIK